MLLSRYQPVRNLLLLPSEKEQPLFHFLKVVSIQAAFSGSFAGTLQAFLPLPAGEGWGEGEAFSEKRRSKLKLV